MPLPDFTNRRAIDDVLTRLDTTGVGRRDFLKLASAGAALMSGGLLAACGGKTTTTPGASASVTDKSGRLTFLIMTNQLQYDVQMDAAAKTAAKHFGFTYTSLDGKLDAQLQLNQFQQTANQGAKAVIVHSPDGSNIREITKQGEAKQIYVANVWGTQAWFTPFDVGDYYTLYAQPDEFLVQGKATKLLAEKIGGKGNIVRVSGVKGNSADVIRSAGADAALKDFPDVKLAADLPGNWNPEDSQKAMASLLSRVPDLKGVIAQNDDIATGVIAALRAGGRKAGEDVFVIGADGTDLAAKRIEDGTQLATTANVPAYGGYLLNARLFDVQNGWKPRAGERLLQWESVILTKDNLTPYLERYVDAKKPPFNAKLLSHVQAGGAWDPQFLLYPVSDLDVLWGGNKKPAGWKPPTAWQEAKDSGELDAIAKEYKAAYKAQVLGASPA
jgi:ABC-type sugar transport system substrate-binding protein